MPKPTPAALRDLDRIGFLHAPHATLVLADRVILRANRQVEAVFGWTIAELEGQSIRMIYPGQTDYQIIGERARRAMQQNQVYRDERFMRRKDGAVVWMEGSGVALDAEDPQRIAIWTYRPLDAKTVTDTGLTAAERRVAGYLVGGFTSKEIAVALGCSPRTVEVHRANMIRKYKVRNSSELVGRLLSSTEGAKT